MTGNGKCIPPIKMLMTFWISWGWFIYDIVLNPHWNRKMSSNDPSLTSRLLPPPLKDCQQGFPARPGWDAASGLGVVTQWAPVGPVGLASGDGAWGCAWWGSQRWYGWCEKPLQRWWSKQRWCGDLINKELRNLGRTHQVSWICSVYIHKLSHTININKFLPTWLAKRIKKVLLWGYGSPQFYNRGLLRFLETPVLSPN